MTAPLPAKFKVGLVQMSMTDDPEANRAKAVARIREAAELVKYSTLREQIRTVAFSQMELFVSRSEPRP